MKRLSKSILLGALLGIACIIGVSLRMGLAGNELFILGTYYNRIIMGLVIGLADRIKIKPLIRGALLGLAVSFALYLSTDFKDPMGFTAGIIYGIIIDSVASNDKK